MEPKFLFYTPADFGSVYQFLKNHPNADYLPYERVRFQLSYGLHPDFCDNGIHGGFARSCGIWRAKGEIAGLVMTEGGAQFGEAFFAFRADEDKTPELLGRMCDFAERFSSKVSEDGKSNSYKLCVPEWDTQLTEFVARRGYQRQDYALRNMQKAYPAQPEPVKLPEGFVIRDAREVAPFYTSLAHSISFRYNRQNDGGEKGFAALRTMPDYRPELDLVLFDPEGQPAGLANFWVSEKSPVAILEPLGVAWWYRRMGLGEALITEGINRTRAFGCNSLIGGDQPFYKAIGFEEKAVSHLWEWRSA